MQTTKTLLDLKLFIEEEHGTTILGSDECTNQQQADMLARHARTMIMMYKATGERRYLAQAKLDIHRAKSILRSGFIRPLGVTLYKAA